MKMLIGLVVGLLLGTAVGVWGQAWIGENGNLGLWYKMPGGMMEFQSIDPNGNLQGGLLLPLPGAGMPLPGLAFPPPTSPLHPC